MTEVIKRGNYLVRPQLVPVAERETMQAQVARATANFKKFIKSSLGRKIIHQLPPDIAIPLGQGYCLTNKRLVWDNWHRIVGGNSLPRFVPVPPTHYQAVVRAFALTQKELKPEAIIPHIKNYLFAHPK